jgi:hypothetical protein
VAVLGLLGVCLLLILHVGGWWGFDDNVDGTTITLLLIGLFILLGLASPDVVRQILDRVENVELPGGVKVGLSAVARAERAQAPLLRIPDEVGSDDDVRVSTRPDTGDARLDLEKVRERLQTRLRFLRDAVLDLPEDTDYPGIVAAVESEDLLTDDELGLVADILERAESEIDKWPASLQKEFLDAAWRFSVRFATLVFERYVRRRLKDAGWFLAEFDQARDHRPDFLSWRDGAWLQVAARVQPNKLAGTRQRLSRSLAPFGPTPVVVIPTERAADYTADDRYESVVVIDLDRLLNNTAPVGAVN